jgi:hypothetical protein
LRSITLNKEMQMAITFNQLIEAAQDGTIGFCLACTAENYGVEPDARKYECEECGEPRVYGAEELLMMVGA